MKYFNLTTTVVVFGLISCVHHGPVEVKNGYSKLEMSHGVYEGQFKNDTASGFGQYIRKDGTRYSGQWKNNMWDGVGSAYWAAGPYAGDSCLAIFRNNELNGFGHYHYRNHMEYIGNFKNSQSSGVGKLLYKSGAYNGDIYLGIWKDGQIGGWGRYYDASIKEYRTGVFGNNGSFKDSLINAGVFDSLEKNLRHQEDSVVRELRRLEAAKHY